MPLVDIRNVSKHFGEQVVLQDVSLAVEAHAKVVICGPSGSGKSTLLRCVNGLAPYDGGSIEVDGTLVTQERSSLERVRRQVGMVFQSFNLFPHLTVLQNCTLAPMTVRHLSAAEARTEALARLERVHVAGLAERFPSELSGGEQQRVAIARALCMNPKVLLFDEPTSSLDPVMVHEVLDAIAELAESGMTTLCVTHELRFAQRLADNVIFMDKGAVIESGPPGQLFAAPRSEQLRTFLRREHLPAPGDVGPH
ncbi:MAG: amino acid ABC transporter ATP-binding protein [Proteobacteria bacterium]|nr:amino acid ABC transporter ATP-binding protein [Pseudomonadota bacterium]